MTNDENRLVVAQYEDAIEKLEAYAMRERDDAKAAAADAKIKEYRRKIIDVSWASITGRTEALNGLVADLNQIIERASNVPSLSGALNDLAGVVTRAGGVVTKAREAVQRIVELACKTKECREKVKHVLDSATLNVGPSGTVSVTLTCPSGHQHKYEIVP